MVLFPGNKELQNEDYSIHLCPISDLEASYSCCRFRGVPVELSRLQRILERTELALRLAADYSLILLVERVIAPVCGAGRQKNYICILCDPDLVALKIFAAPEILAAAGEAGIKPGAVFTEESCGTNALALAREHDRLVAIRGEQHYCRLFKDWWCVAGPVKNQEGKILGYLDISMDAEKELSLTAALLKTLLNSIKREYLLLDLLRCRQAGVFSPAEPPVPLPPEVKNELSLRESEVLQLLLCRLSNKEIAEKLHLSVATVRSHRQKIYQKLDVGNLTGLLSRISRLAGHIPKNFQASI